MQKVELAAMLRGFIEACTTLERETAAFIIDMQTAGPAEFVSFDTLRQNLMVEIQNIDRELQLLINKGECLQSVDSAVLLKNFAVRQKEHMLRILELDASLIKAANEHLELVGSELTSLGRGRRALKGYGNSASLSGIALDREA